MKVLSASSFIRIPLSDLFEKSFKKGLTGGVRCGTLLKLSIGAGAEKARKDCEFRESFQKLEKSS